MSPSLPVPLLPAADLTILCDPATAADYRAPLAHLYRFFTTDSPDAAIVHIAHSGSPLLIVDGDHSGADVCRQAHQLMPSPPAVLVTMSAPAAAAHVVDVCDSILLKPFEPNLLVSRVSRLLRRSRDLVAHGALLRSRSQQVIAKGEHLAERSRTAGLIEWPTSRCPHCGHARVAMFDHAANRQAWYACAECRKVWIAHRILEVSPA